MFAENPQVHAELVAIVRRITTDARVEDDLLQQALWHLVRKQWLEPGHTLSWYLKNCKFHLLDYLGQGRSIDALNHRSGRYTYIPSEEYEDPSEKSEDHTEDSEEGTVPVAPGADVVSLVSAKDILNLLLPRLKPLDQRVLQLLDDGYSRRQIALEIGISQSKAVRACKRIAELATHFHISPKFSF